MRCGICVQTTTAVAPDGTVRSRWNQYCFYVRRSRNGGLSVDGGSERTRYWLILSLPGRVKR